MVFTYCSVQDGLLRMAFSAFFTVDSYLVTALLLFCCQFLLTQSIGQTDRNPGTVVLTAFICIMPFVLLKVFCEIEKVNSTDTFQVKRACGLVVY